VNQERRLSGDGIEANHVPEKPRLHCSSVAVSRET
jgi:hypothetical protein